MQIFYGQLTVNPYRKSKDSQVHYENSGMDGWRYAKMERHWT